MEDLIPILETPQIDDIDPESGETKYANFAEYEEARDAWNRQEAIREFHETTAKQPAAKTSEDLGGIIIGFAFLALLSYGVWAGISWVSNAPKNHGTTEASVSDSRDEQIRQLNAKVAALEANPKAEHHYEFRALSHLALRPCYGRQLHPTDNKAGLEAARDTTSELSIQRFSCCRAI
jgi:hypothetical protein